MNEGRDRLVERITALKARRKAIILAHNYQLGEIQDIADFVGDSLELSQRAADSQAEVIIFCGVHFMAETAAILCPDKVVLLSHVHAGCPMADMVTAEALRQKKAEHPGATVVCYVNSSAEVKAESDVCCTSANALDLVRGLDSTEILFVPDKYLGHYVAAQTGKQMVLWPGYCPTHTRIQATDIARLKSQHPQAEVMVHPECRPDVIELADFVLSTGGMCRHARATAAREIIVGTEIGLVYRLRKENPEKVFIPISEQAICPTMKLTRLENVLWCLEEMSPRVEVPQETRLRAKAAVDKMLGG
ncbi:MAG: quinolinate synthase [Chloroflexi bacterium]|nr:MAG: quinolinate synthase [Chloroflexota bacterium]